MLQGIVPMHWKGHEKMCTVQCRRGIVNRRSQFNETDESFKRVPGMFRAEHEVSWTWKELSRWHSLYDRLHCSSPDRASKAQAEVQTHRSENLLSHLHLSYHTWSDGRKLLISRLVCQLRSIHEKGQNLLHDGRASFCHWLKCQWKEVRQCKSPFRKRVHYLYLCAKLLLRLYKLVLITFNSQDSFF